MFVSPPSDSESLLDIQNVLKPAQKHLDALNLYLAEEVKGLEPEVQELARYCLQHTGKKIRPILVFYSGWQGADAEPQSELIRAAAILELVHQATLVHDDILDGAKIRHNFPTLNQEYNTQVAVLLGDILFSHALKLASDFPTVKVCRAVSQATRRVCAGEVGQTFQHRSPAVTLEDYYRVIDLKTAELFRVSCELGAELSGYEPTYVKAAAVFGRHLGIAYQIFDDLADLTGKESTIGKTLGTDLENGKFTLPMLLLLDCVDTTLRNHLIQEVQSGKPVSQEWVDLIYTHKIPAKVEAAFNEEIQAAEQALTPYAHLAPFESLMGLSRFICQQLAQLRKNS